MRKFSTGGYTFYMLQRGERAPDPFADNTGCGACLIWPRKNGRWDVREFIRGEWQEITFTKFDSESDAFNFVYDRYCERIAKYCRRHDAARPVFKYLSLPVVRS